MCLALEMPGCRLVRAAPRAAAGKARRQDRRCRQALVPRPCRGRREALFRGYPPVIS
jgi:hypothetical protein